MAKSKKLISDLLRWRDYNETDWLQGITDLHYAKIQQNRWFRELFFSLPFKNLEDFFDYDNYYITPEALWNILSKHYLHDGSENKRRFTVPLFELLQIILNGKAITPQPLRHKKLLIRIISTPHKVIGTKSDGSPTTIATILTTLNGQIQTVFPATSKRFIVLNPAQIKACDDDPGEEEEAIFENHSLEEQPPIREDIVEKYRLYKRFFKNVIEGPKPPIEKITRNPISNKEG